MQKKLALVLIVFILGTAGWMLLVPSDEDQIKELFEQISTQSTAPVSQHPLEQVMLAKSIIGHFHFPFEIRYQYQERTYTKRIPQDEFMNHLMSTISYMAKQETPPIVKAKLMVDKVEINDSTHALVTLSLHASGEIYGHEFDESGMILSKVVKVKDDWKLHSFEKKQD